MTWLIVVMPLIAVALLLPPLFRPGRDKAADRESELDMLLLKKRALIAAIRELDFDREMGKLSAEDHETQRRIMKGEAAKTIRQIESRGGKKRV
ncbi:MAG: hypothetical protein ABIK65_02105 [Candidatus Eisenbacteria bacterium]